MRLLVLALALCMASPVWAQRAVPETAAQVTLSFAPLVKRVAPAVVNVYAARKPKRSGMMDDPFFRRFLDPSGRPPARLQQSLGSGVVVDASGFIVTNVHVIEGADEVKVATNDGREFEAEIVLLDKPSDLAVLRVPDMKDVPYLAVADSDEIEVGDLVLAVGNPFGVGQTVTNGIVSALARSRVGTGEFGFFIQTDASINPGNSGGALVDMRGRLVGVNTAIFSRSGGSNGIGFAVPSNMVKAVLASAKAGSKSLMRPFLGASFEAVTPDIAQALGMRRPFGALVVEVFDDSPAARVGLRAGDVVLALDGRPIEHVDALGYRLAIAGIGKAVEMQVLSRDQRRSVRVALAEGKAPAPRVVQIDGRSPLGGMRVARMSPAWSSKFRLPRGLQGVVVVDLQRGGQAARAGLRPGDMVVSVNGEAITDPAALAKIATGRPLFWRIELNRRGRRVRFMIR